MPIDNVV